MHKKVIPNCAFLSGYELIFVFLNVKLYNSLFDLASAFLKAWAKLPYLSHVRESTKMKKIMQNVVLLMKPNEFAFMVSMKAGKMCLNRFCIDEDAAFESTGVYYLEKARLTARKEKGRGNIFSCIEISDW